MRRWTTAMVMLVTMSAAAPGAMAQPRIKKAAMSPTLSKALRQYASKDFHGATLRLYKVSEGGTLDTRANQQRAEFWMGKTLYHLGFYSASQSYFSRIVQQGNKHRFHFATLKWLASLSRKLPETSGILNLIGKYKASNLTVPQLRKVRWECQYLLGRHRYQRGAFKEAVQLLSAVPPTSHFFAQAKMLEAVTHVRQYRAKPAAKAYKAVLRHARQSKKKTTLLRRMEELALISLARLFYSVKQYDKAVKYFGKVPAGSTHRPAADFEVCWAHFRGGAPARALKGLRAVLANKTRPFPEAHILEAVIHHKAGHRKKCARALGGYFKRYPKQRKEMEALLKKYKDPFDMYKVAVKLRGKSKRLSAAERLIRPELDARSIKKSFDYVDGLNRQLVAIQKAPPAWKATAIAGVVLQDLTLQRSLAVNEAGQLAWYRVKRIARQLQDLSTQGHRIKAALKKKKGR